MKVNNLPADAHDHKYLTFRYVNDEAWFYGAWDTYDQAFKQAREIRGYIIPIEEVR